MVAKDLQLLEEDQDPSEKLIYINNFLAKIFAALSLSAFRSNSMLSVSLGAPSWLSTQWDGSENSQVFGTNCVLTCDGVRNIIHTDNDESLYTSAVGGIVEKQTRQLITSEERLKLLRLDAHPKFHFNALGAKFHVVTSQSTLMLLMMLWWSSTLKLFITHLILPTNQLRVVFVESWPDVRPHLNFPGL